MAVYESPYSYNQAELRKQTRRKPQKSRITTALRAAATAGYSISKFEISADGSIVVFVRFPGQDQSSEETSLDVRKLL